MVVASGWIEEKGGLDSMMNMEQRLREIYILV